MRCRGLGARELGRVHVAHNAIAVTVDASALPAISAVAWRDQGSSGHSLSALRWTRPCPMSALPPCTPRASKATASLSPCSTRASTTRIAISADRERRLHMPPRTALSPATRRTKRAMVCFRPTKVIEGFDFVGEAWPNGDRTEDPDPIDAPGAPVAMGGHGTHVADIIAGKTADGSHKGVAPGASLLAVKVCSAVSTSCNGVALLARHGFRARSER